MGWVVVLKFVIGGEFVLLLVVL
ncbi:hypothetical protein EMIT0P294_50316 [Pseudomonas sp. IT-P294]